MVSGHVRGSYDGIRPVRPAYMDYWLSLFGQDGGILAKFLLLRVYGKSRGFTVNNRELKQL